jgi:hypothetical protein
LARSLCSWRTKRFTFCAAERRVGWYGVSMCVCVCLVVVVEVAVARSSGACRKKEPQTAA